MTLKDANEILDNWFVGYDKGFKYIDPDLFGIEWVVIKKIEEDLYEVLFDRSSCKAGPFTRAHMQKLIGSNKLLLYNSAFDVDFKYKKSNGCTCGMWSTQNPDCHTWWCDKRKLW